ncbi:MAG TPA: RNA repair transcriptional activator RtcR [Clostridia bacterium]|nr:RNA repair transcriptional activator RtcR [Clostridia bacterium]
MITRKRVVIGLLGSVLDSGFHEERWKRWRPTISLCKHAELPVDRFELIYDPRFTDTAGAVMADIPRVSPATEVRGTPQALRDAWDFEEVYAALHEFARGYDFKPETEDYLVHITTGSHVQQICLFLLTESRHFPARLVQTSPADTKRRGPDGKFAIIDLDLSKYDRLAARFGKEQKEARSFLKSGIATRSKQFNQLIEQIEHVAIHAKEPILLTGPTGAGKSQLARRIYELKKSRHQIGGAFVEVNCATLRGDAAMSALFGHVRGAFTGALRDRPGLLRAADNGVLFLDEIGELGLDEQAMLLRALEDKRFLPFGGDREVSSNFQLIAGTNRELPIAVREGRFREDLLARTNLWTFHLPGLRQRPEDIEPNLDYELDQYARKGSLRVTMSTEVREDFLKFAQSPAAKWSANFRDLNACITRMATLSPGGRITAAVLAEEIERLKAGWSAPKADGDHEAVLAGVLSEKAREQLDLFDRAQLAFVIQVCRESATLSDAGRKLFAATRENRKTANDADRLRKYLARFDLDWHSLK